MTGSRPVLGVGGASLSRIVPSSIISELLDHFGRLRLQQQCSAVMTATCGQRAEAYMLTYYSMSAHLV